MKKLLVTFCTILSLSAFAQTDTLTLEKITREFFPHQTIELKTNEGRVVPEMKAGDKVVFQYSKQSAENPMVSDDEMFESVLFEANAEWNSFEYRKKMALSKATYQLGCFCVERGYFEIKKGYIKGKKLRNGNYFIEANVTFTFKNGQSKSIKFKGEFKAVHAG
jgi:hypothetical protein